MTEWPPIRPLSRISQQVSPNVTLWAGTVGSIIDERDPSARFERVLLDVAFRHGRWRASTNASQVDAVPHPHPAYGGSRCQMKIVACDRIEVGYYARLRKNDFPT